MTTREREQPRASGAGGAMHEHEHELVRDVLAMYRDGWFPMHDERHGRAEWVQPRRRGIIPLGDGREDRPDGKPDGGRSFLVPRSLRAAIRRGTLRVTSDQAFANVIRACAAPAPGREETWLNAEIIGAFELLHRAGHAHSIEAWRDVGHTPRLVGGLYGLCVGSVFCGESMFSRPDLGGTDASKVCLANLVAHLRRRGFTLLDAQLSNDHLSQFGCYEMPAMDYLAHLKSHRDDRPTWGPFEALREWA